MKIISYYYKKCKAGFQSAAYSIHPKKLLKLTHLWGPDELVIFVTTFQLAVLGSHCEPAISAIGAVGQTETRQRPSGAHLLLLVDDVETWNSKLKEMEGGQKKTRWKKNIMIKTLYETTYHPKFAG